MAGKGAPSGNENAAKGAKWKEAMRRALARDSGTVDKGLDRIADKVVELAGQGESWAIQEVANRMDGKPKEHVHVEHEIIDRESTESWQKRIAERLAARATH